MLGCFFFFKRFLLRGSHSEMDSILLHEFLLKSKLSVKQNKLDVIRGQKCQKKYQKTLCGREPGTTTWLKIFFVFFWIPLDFFHSKEENKWRARLMQISVIFWNLLITGQENKNFLKSKQKNFFLMRQWNSVFWVRKFRKKKKNSFFF